MPHHSLVYAKQFYLLFAKVDVICTPMKTIPAEKIILGIDPGTRFMGYGVIMIEQGQLKLLQYGVITLTKYNTPELRLKKIFERISQIINEFSPDEVALEAPFYGKNVQSMLKLGRAQGVAMSAALNKGIPIKEYSPKSVKQAVTGNGNASKEQVAAMLEATFKMKLEQKLFDATDAIGIALCHYYQDNSIMKARATVKKAPKTKAEKNAGWASFLNQNPDRIKEK